MIEISIIGLAFYTFGIFALGATIGAAIGGQLPLLISKRRNAMYKKIISILIVCLIFLTSCGNANISLEAEKVNLETKISELEQDVRALQSEKNNLENLIRDLREENDIPRYVVTFEIGQQHVTLDLGDLLKDEFNKTELEIMVSKEYYDAIDVGTVVNDEFRVGSLALKGSFGSWNIKVIDKRIEY